MVKYNMNIMRLLRIQIKTGYMKAEPESYIFMKRYPPVNRDSAMPVRRLEVTSIPYLRLYEDAIAKNPKFLDERIYPAYWQQEPTALTLAKKQYELMKQGLSEKDAYDGALHYTQTLESSAYEEMKTIIEKSGNGEALAPIESDPELKKAMKTFKTILGEVDYSDLDFKDQGEIDFVLQTKILKWKEVERERRMKDPVFAIEFQKLRNRLFPDVSKIRIARQPIERQHTKSDLLRYFNVSESKLCTNAPFYYDDYLFYFKKAQAEPLLGRWNIRDRQNFSRWITDTLAVREIVERSLTTIVQRYLDDLRAQFFPMVRYPDRAMSFTLPDIDDFKAILYANDVGYKRKDDKLFVHRIHKLPMLLFPKETFTTALLTDRKKLMNVMDSEQNMMDEVKNAGLDIASVEELRQQLKQYSGAAVGQRTGYQANLNMSALDRLVSQDDDDEFDSSDDSNSDSDSDSDEEVEKKKVVRKVTPAVQDPNIPVYKVNRGVLRHEVNEDEWAEVVQEYRRKPTTELERVRESFLGSEVWRTEAAATEKTLKIIRNEIQENDMIIRARLSRIYEDKEAARRSHVWTERGIYEKELPMPHLRLLDE